MASWFKLCFDFWPLKKEMLIMSLFFLLLSLVSPSAIFFYILFFFLIKYSCLDNYTLLIWYMNEFIACHTNFFCPNIDSQISTKCAVGLLLGQDCRSLICCQRIISDGQIWPYSDSFGSWIMYSVQDCSAVSPTPTICVHMHMYVCMSENKIIRNSEY